MSPEVLLHGIPCGVVALMAGVNVESDYDRARLDICFSVLVPDGQGHPGFYSYGTRIRDGHTLLPSRRNVEPSIGVLYMPRRSRG